MSANAGTTAMISNITFDDYWQQLTNYLKETWSAGIAQFFQTLPQTQIKTIANVVGGGRHVRAHLLCLVNAALGGRIDNALPRALAIECIHAASLIHDDYVDQDNFRRQSPATWVLEGPRQAVLLGDIIFATAILRMTELSRADGLVTAETIATMAHGAYRELLDTNELHQLLNRDYPYTTIYDQLIYLKTGALFAAAAKLGAIAAGAEAETCARAFRFGALFGEAYQIADDLDDIVALETDWRKASGKLQFLLPAFHYFYGNEFSIAWLQSKNSASLQRWFQRKSLILKTRMSREITRRTNLAVSELTQFPANLHTAWLRSSPKVILRKPSP